MDLKFSAPHAMEADLRFFSVPEEVSQRIEELEKGDPYWLH